MSNGKYHNPPRLAQRFLFWFCKPELVEDIAGDLEEDFNDFVTKYSPGRARLKYWLAVLRFLRPFAVRKLFKIQINNSMFSINSKIALRNLGKHKLYSFINISGLALGIAACLIIAHYVLFQLSFDQSFENSDTLYRVHTTSYQNGKKLRTTNSCAFGLGYALRRDVPDFEKLSLVHEYEEGAIVSRVVDSANSNAFPEPNLLFVEPSFLDMFSIEFIAGSSKGALEGPMSVILTQSMAEKHFGIQSGSPVGEALTIQGNWGVSGEFLVTGVIKDFPANSHLAFDFLLPMSNVLKDDQYGNPEAEWSWNNFSLYAQLTPQSSEQTVEQKISPLMRTYIGERMKKNSRDATLSIQPIGDIYLQSEVEKDSYGSMDSIYFIAAIGLLILTIAWINFINLSTAKATERSREVGIKKAMGASRRSLVLQFLTESFWLNLCSVLLGTLIAYLLIPELGHIIGERFSLNLTDSSILLLLGALLLISPLLAGFYPAFFMSAFNTVKSLKGSQSTTSGNRISLRKVLVVSQFTISTLMITGTFVVSQQLTFLRSQNTGIDMSEILVVRGPSGEVSPSNIEKFRNDVSSIASISSLTSSRSIPGAPYNWGTGMTKLGAEKSTRKGIDVTFIDHDFFKTYDIEMLAGRDFTDAIRDFPNPDDAILKNGVILNEATLKSFELGSPEEALNEKLLIGPFTFTVRGVMADHNWKSLHSPITPGVFMYTPANSEYFSLRLDGKNIKEALSQIERSYTESFPGNPLDYFFLDDFFNRQYKADREFSRIFNGFAFFAISAACLGLLGLTAFGILQKAKEIGIRKVLGAKMSQITYLFSKNYLVLILIANGLAIPLSYFGIQYWLQDFAYAIPISASLFIVPGLALLLIALITISFQTVKVATANPVKSLSSE
ncbi:MAG: ABC transporter permease [Roseivirga sp.]